MNFNLKSLMNFLKTSYFKAGAITVFIYSFAIIVFSIIPIKINNTELTKDPLQVSINLLPVNVVQSKNAIDNIEVEDTKKTEEVEITKQINEKQINERFIEPSQLEAAGNSDGTVRNSEEVASNSDEAVSSLETNVETQNSIPMASGFNVNADSAKSPSFTKETQFDIDKIKKIIDYKIKQNLEYPDAAIRRGIEGDVVFQIVVNSEGSLLSCALIQSSKNSFLDKAAKNLLYSIFPLSEKDGFVSASEDDKNFSTKIAISYKLE